MNGRLLKEFVRVGWLSSKTAVEDNGCYQKKYLFGDA